MWRELLTDPENLTVITEAMLDRGMNPNELVSDEYPDPASEETRFDIPLICVTRFGDDVPTAESLKLLLESGGDPNTVYWIEGSFHENVFWFYVEDEFANGPDLDKGSFYGLLLCAAYGGKYPDGRTPFEMLIDAPISVFKDYDRYWYEYEHHEDYSSTMFVIEKETGKRIARYH